MAPPPDPKATSKHTSPLCAQQREEVKVAVLNISTPFSHPRPLIRLQTKGNRTLPIGTCVTNNCLSSHRLICHNSPGLRPLCFRGVVSSSSLHECVIIRSLQIQPKPAQKTFKRMTALSARIKVTKPDSQ